MANTPKPKSNFIDDVVAFVKDKKKLPLLLLLLGGSATVVTTAAVVLSSPGSGTSSSQGGNTTSQGGSTTSQGSSNAPISGNEVPDWNLENPTLSASGSGVGRTYDITNNGRYQNDYFYQAGRMYFEGAPLEQITYSEIGFSVHNIRTGQTIFDFMFDFGQPHRDALIAGTVQNPWFFIAVAFDQESTIYINMEAYLPSTIGGNYTALRNHAVGKYGSFPDNTYFQFLLAFDISDDDSYTILDSRRSTSDAFDLRDILFENNRLYASTQFRSSFLQNNQHEDDENLFDFMEKPTQIPTFTQTLENAEFHKISFITEISIEGTTLEVLEHTPVSSNYSSNVWFRGYTQGFETRYFTEEGHMVISVNMHSLHAISSSGLSNSFMNVETTFLPDDSIGFNEVREKASEALTKILETPNGNIYNNFNYNLNFLGFFNFETEKFEHSFSGYGVYASNHSGGVEKYANAYSHPQLYTTDSGDMFVIENQLLTAWENNGQINDWAQYNPDYMLDAVSNLSRYDLETGDTSLVLEHDNDGTIIQAVYEKSDGYYVSGSYYETPSNNVKSVDAFLRATTSSFGTEQELTLSGSNDDVGLGIVLNASGQPVWIVMSNSNDGDFEDLDAEGGNFNFYYVSF
jgi:hypothetical protein